MSNLTSSMRPLEIGDAEVLRDLAILTYRETYNPFLSKDEIDARINSNYRLEDFIQLLGNRDTQFLWGIFHKNNLVAYLYLSTSDESTSVIVKNLIQLNRIYVHPEFKGKGLGKQLMQKAESFCKEQNQKGIWLHCLDQNTASIQFYQKSGYDIVGSDPFEILPGKVRIDIVLIKRI